MDADRRRVLYVARRYAVTTQTALDQVLRCRYLGIEDIELTPAQRRRVRRKRVSEAENNDLELPE